MSPIQSLQFMDHLQNELYLLTDISCFLNLLVTLTTLDCYIFVIAFLSSFEFVYTIRLELAVFFFLSWCLCFDGLFELGGL